jgi:hypothetical protein
MDGQEVSATRLFSSSGTVRLLAYGTGNEIEYIGLANFNAPEGETFWYITKFTWGLSGTCRVILRIEDNGTKHKWTDRASMPIMGWRV